ncbi:bifunctional folylpolyglutamate synthase/dihydrofolate synthase [Emcibacter nanhaiensis]|uniref:Dihydrofolate synthase/folylpolyglutamate synthase n=1 Tax=Emcibacter nanhaiensis TaxID=1505037 RepID=A0A501PPD3_9PROT|nr:folylpolyglutamate synthase/dihydrofolate synthase family protein [Emcibacter nanhaiensis]TPD61844.1 bifunctional folylpolyglutamate synthase/dihydrofolate synthase [Emcibacter nanhaiensis]
MNQPDDSRLSDQVLDRLYRLHPKKIDLSLDRVERLLAALDHPEQKLPPVIHVAGTNGKGSTTAFLRAILEAAGLRVHVYTSPHLVKFAERIRLAGKLISEDYLLELLDICEQANGEQPITYFEMTTALAFKAFADVPADVVLLEVGLGGRFDATNVIDQPLSTVITPVSLDHEQFLGSDLAGIGREKAGIAKKGVPLIVAPQPPVILDAILEVAKERQAIPVAAGYTWKCTPTEDCFLYEDFYGEMILPQPVLPGLHQRENAALAIACLRHQRTFEITEQHIRTGLQTAEWPARMQDLSKSTLAKTLPAGSELWLDGGHNPAAGEIIADLLRDRKDLPLFLVCGMMANKDTGGFLAPLAPLTTTLYGIHVPGEESHSAEAIAEMARDAGIEAVAMPGFEESLDLIGREQTVPVRVLICGSLYLAGKVLALTEN